MKASRNLQQKKKEEAKKPAKKALGIRAQQSYVKKLLLHRIITTYANNQLGEQRTEILKQYKQTLESVFYKGPLYKKKSHYKIVYRQILQLLQTRSESEQNKPSQSSRKPMLDVDFLKAHAKAAIQGAIRENKALGIPITYLEGKKIIVQPTKGRKRVIATLK